jgi:hypothetical protein
MEAEGLVLRTNAQIESYRREVNSVLNVSDIGLQMRRAAVMEQYERDVWKVNRRMLGHFSALLPVAEVVGDDPRPQYRCSELPVHPNTHYLGSLSARITCGLNEYPALRSHVVWADTQTDKLERSSQYRLSDPMHRHESSHRTTLPYVVAGATSRQDAPEVVDAVLISGGAQGKNISFGPQLQTVSMWAENWAQLSADQLQLLRQTGDPRQLHRQVGLSSGRLVLDPTDDSGLVHLGPDVRDNLAYFAAGKPVHGGMGKRPGKRLRSSATRFATLAQPAHERWGSYEDMDRFQVVERLGTMATFLGREDQWMRTVYELGTQAPEDILSQLQRLQ